MNYLVDTHCHLDLISGIQANPQAENIFELKTISVTNAPSFYNPNIKLFKDLDNIRIALGLHPQLISQYSVEIVLFEKMIASAKYVGEIGLDGSADLKLSYTMQVKIFERILNCIRNNDKKVITIHSRNAAAETIQLLSKYLKGTQNSVILHWFTGNKVELKEGIKNNYYFSINHKMVNTDKGKETIKMIPDDLLLTETDAPFTFSQGVKGRVQSIEHTLNAIAAIRGIGRDDCQQLVFKNFKRMITL